MENGDPICLDRPGQKVQLPTSIIAQLKYLHPKYRNRLMFFGGHPVSMTKQSFHSIFSSYNSHEQYSPYLLCQKTDGVRYLLLITRTKTYMISRQGNKTLCAYQVNCTVGKSWPKFQTLGLDSPYKQIIEILDGELIEDTYDQNNSKFRYLIFDVLIHMGSQVTHQPLGLRLDYIQKFMRCNQFQLIQKSIKTNQIQLKIKDFFRLSIQKFNVIQFLLRTYIKCLPHQNDGLIFNHQQKQYIFGQNDGYIKWKPPHLNTLDFFVVPNTNLIDRFGKTVIDLYLGLNNQDTGAYTRIFYNFAVVPQHIFEQISILTDKKNEQFYKKQQAQSTDYFIGIIAQCKYQQTNSSQRQIYKQLFNLRLDPQQIQQLIMKKNYDDKQIQVVKQLQKIVYIKNWKVYKIRKDKNMPNNYQVAKKIQQSIKDNINQEELIKKNKEMLHYDGSIKR